MATQTAADAPDAASFASVKDRLTRAFKRSGKDNVGIVAAGVAYYAFLAIFPMLASAVLIYGLAVEPHEVAAHIGALATRLPGPAAELIAGQLEQVVNTSSGKKGFGLLLAVALALFGARNGAGATITALGIAFELPDNRSFVRRNLLAILLTIGTLVGAGLAVLAIGALAALSHILPPGLGGAAMVGKIISYSVLGLGAIVGAALLYHYGPDRPAQPLRLFTAGSVFAGVCLMLLTLGFGIYVSNFSDYNATYGSLGAVVVLLTWLYLSAYVLLLGAEVNAVEGCSAT